MLIDIDSHVQEPFDWMDREFPDLAAKVPGVDFAATVAEQFVGEAFADIPPEYRPDKWDLIPKDYQPFVRALPEGPRSGIELAKWLDELTGEIGGILAQVFKARGAADAAERVELMDEVGIDIQFLNPSMAPLAADRVMRQLGDVQLAQECLAAYNTWIASTVEGYTDRLLPSCYTLLYDVDAAVGELTRMREKGSRTFHVPAVPVEGKSLAHPDYEPLWSAAEDLGMGVMFHVGHTGRSLLDSGWANAGPNFRPAFANYVTQPPQVPEVALTALIFGGVFERHPKLIAVSEELEINWVPVWVDKMDRLAEGKGLMKFGFYDLPLKPSEYVQRNVIVSPLAPVQPLRPTMDLIPPGIVVFASDYPHPEGGPIAAAKDTYLAQLDGFDDDAIDQFLGRAVADAFDLAR